MVKNKKGSEPKPAHQEKGAGRVININESTPSGSAGKNRGGATITQSCATPPRPTSGKGK